MLEASPPLEKTAFYPIADTDAVKQAQALGTGARGVIVLGGKHDVNAGGEPLRVRGTVIKLTDGSFRTDGPVCGEGSWQHLGKFMAISLYW